MAKILVIGDDLRSFLSVVRSLGKAGHEIHCFTDRFLSPAFTSKYINTVHKAPILYADYQAWLLALENLDAYCQFDYIFPCTDQTLLPLMDGEHNIKRDKIISAGDKAFHIFLDKVKTHESAKACDVAMAAYYDFKSSGVDKIDLTFPLYLKPKSSIALNQLSGKSSVQKINTSSELQAFIDNNSDSLDGYFLEQSFDGVGVGVSVLANKGILTAAFQHKRLAEGVSGGSSVRTSVPLHQGILAATRRLAQQAGLHGLAMFEFRHNIETDEFILLEVNARVWGSLPLAIYAGVDFPRLLLEQLENKHESNSSELPTYSLGKIGRALTPSIYDFRRSITGKGALGKLLAMVTACAIAGFRVIGFREKIDTFDWRDIKPFMGEACDQVRMILTKLGRVSGLLPWAQARKARALLKSKKDRIQNILILCYGNICRSPYMEHSLACSMNDENIKITSAGFHMPVGRVSPTDAQTVSHEMGYSLQDHRSKMVTDDMVRGADIIFIFDARNDHDLADFFPDAVDKSINVGLLLDGKQDVEDPYGKGQGAFEKCYTQINQISAVVKQALKGGKS